MGIGSCHLYSALRHNARAYALLVIIVLKISACERVLLADIDLGLCRPSARIGAGLKYRNILGRAGDFAVIRSRKSILELGQWERLSKRMLDFDHTFC
jgi:hypothetical protein